MAYTPIELTKNGKTRVASNLAEETKLRWDGWLPTGQALTPQRTLAELLGGDVEAALKAVRAMPGPLAGIGKAASQPYRILQVGTSIANSPYSPNKVMVEALRGIYGASTMTRSQAGILGGSYINAVNGWSKQPFSGVSFGRLRGSSTSTALTDTWQGYGDQVVIEWSRETDTASAEVLVDGVSVGTFGSPGPQRFGMRTVFTVPRAAHTVTINPPASGYSYIEAVEVRDSARRGVETIDGTLGGSSLANAATVRLPQGAMVAGIATTPGAGIEALFGRTDVDLILMSFTVNDAGYNPGDPTAADYRKLLEATVAATRGSNTPVVFIVEPAGSYALPVVPTYGTAMNARFEAVRTHQLQVAALNPHVTVVDWDAATRLANIAAYAAKYYPSVSGLDLATGTFSGDFIHPDGSLANSSQQVGTRLLADALSVASATPAERTPFEIELASYAASGVAVLPYSTGTDNAFPRQVGPLYRDPAATNLAPSLNNDIAAAGTSDSNGKYLLAANYNFYPLGTTVSSQRMLTIRIGPNDAGLISIRGSDSALRFYDPDGVELTPTVTPYKTIHFSGVPAGTVITIGVPISQDASNKYLTITGRIYECTVTSSRAPLLVAAP